MRQAECISPSSDLLHNPSLGPAVGRERAFDFSGPYGVGSFAFNDSCFKSALAARTMVGLDLDLLPVVVPVDFLSSMNEC